MLFEIVWVFFKEKGRANTLRVWNNASRSTNSIIEEEDVINAYCNIKPSIIYRLH